MFRALDIIKLKVMALCLLPVILLNGCLQIGGGIIRMDLQAPVINLDPQFATDPTAQMLLLNLLEGLVVQSPTGELISGCAESWDISADGLVYTFHLRDGLYWADEQQTPLVAGDFVFGLSRLFSSPPSPYAADFAAIKGTEQSISGNKFSLGIRATDTQTLVITLERPDPMLLTRLSGTAALPCRREFFEDCRGRYGLEQAFILSNGPFVLKEWDNAKQILLEKNVKYHSPDKTSADSISFYIGREKNKAQFADNKSQLITLPQPELSQIKRNDVSLYPAGSTIWCIVINTKDPVWRLPVLRQALALSTDRKALSAVLANGLSPIEVFLPEGVLLGESLLSELTDISVPVNYSPDEAHRLFTLGLEMLELDVIPNLTILAPDSSEQVQYLGALQQSWQRELALYPRIQRLPDDSLLRRVADGDFQAALLPFAAQSAQAADILEPFAQANHAEYRNPIYNSFIAEARKAADVGDMARLYAQAQRLLLADAPVIPLYEEKAYCVVSDNIEGLWVYPLGGRLYFNAKNVYE